MAMTSVHIIGGTFGLLAGYVALYSVKGATLHRKSGKVFVYAMLIMTLTGATMAASGGSEGVAGRTIGILLLVQMPAAFLVESVLMHWTRPSIRKRTGPVCRPGKSCGRHVDSKGARSTWG